MPDDTNVPARREFLRKSLTLIPVVTLASTGLPQLAQAAEPAKPAPAPAQGPATPYSPTLLTPAQWAFVNAACDRLIPADATGPGAVESGVPQFLDRHLQSPYANGAIWYMQGPFLEAAPEFGYQGKLNLREIIQVGISAFDAACQKSDGKAFAELPHSRQEELLKAAEAGKLQLDGISAKLFFTNLLTEVRNGYFADPSYGANKDMAAWKMIGYPGVRADFIDWVTVRDTPYPLGPVDLAGRRG